MYTIQIEVTDSKTQRPTIRAYALWRTLTNELPEFSGYPISFLAGRYRELLRLESQRVESNAIQAPTELLPFLDEFEFTESGGLAGRAFGVVGVADGTRIETTPVGNVPVTVPKGFVTTEDGLLYELGRPVRSTASDGFTLDAVRTTGLRVAEKGRDATAWPSLLTGLKPDPGPRGSWDPDLVQFGALTTFVIGGALAFETLQHHLTVNIFWV
jgi:hypothetical protein